MKKAVLLTLLTFALAIPALADNDDRHQSYLSYDDGGTVVRSGEDGREIEAHRNLPIYPGDELVTARRGRAEVRLSDGNIIGIDRASAVLFRSILDAYDGDGNETVVELKYGKIGIHRTDIGRDHVRLDTENASYVAQNEAVYSVETDAQHRDRVTVFDGSLEVRTPTRATRLREGESATVDDRGVYDLIGDQRTGSDDFERWFLVRAERFGSYNSRYMDRRLAYWGDDLDDHGRWVFVTGVGWSWRPYVAVGWRPYYNGYWYSRGGCLTWVSYDPWGWGTYHYGRWAFDPGYGWVWVPGYGYSPAWVYWMYGPSYVGWAPAGWWDCYRPYYNWAYNPYRYNGSRYGFGFYGRVRVGDIDLRPWTFVDSRGVISNRVDRAALTADAIKDRLGRSRDGMVTVGSGAQRFTREEWNDPANTVRRRSLDGRHTGAETGAGAIGDLADMTPFFRRDGNVSGDVRDRVVRSRGASSGSGSGGGLTGGIEVSRRGTSSVAPIGRGSVAPVGRGSVAPIGGGTGTSTGTTPSSGSGSSTGSGTVTEGRRGGDIGGGRVGRGGSTPPSGSQPADSGSSSGSVGRGRDRFDTPGESDAPRSSGPSWRDRSRDRDRGTQDSASPSTDRSSGGSDTWRNRVPDRGSERRAPATPSNGGSGSSSGSSTSSGSSDVPRRVIDGVGGARIRPRDSVDSGSSRSSGGSSSGSSSGRSSGGSSVDRGSRSSGGSSSGSGSSARSSDGGGRSSGGSSSRSSDGGSRSSGSNSSRGESGGGKVKRD